ncbi:Tlg2-vesicle protein [Arthrobotrys conoides]|uniref:Golgi apparatus membrane protein TVP38 n=1 Tax=Arthrobotrys conoides TaxID=74498 RepID=A0AAN8NLC6_9PEZI
MLLPSNHDTVPSELMLLRQSYRSFDQNSQTPYPSPPGLAFDLHITTIRDIRLPQDEPDQTSPIRLPQDEYEKTNYWKFIREKKYWPWWGALIILAALVVLMTVYHKDIVHWLQPVSTRIRSLSWGWIIPVLVLIALSFPPLFGHEIVIVLCGAVYGLWIGFGIVTAGTFSGESRCLPGKVKSVDTQLFTHIPHIVLTYFAFRTILRQRAENLERKNIDYAALARITREGGFWVVFIVRLSVIPGHFSTAVFAVCRVNFWAFAFASLVTLPKQLIIVYLGVIIGNENGGRLVSNIVLGVTFLITVLAGVYILWRLKITRRAMVLDAGLIGGGIKGEGREQTQVAAAEENEQTMQTGSESPEAVGRIETTSGV